MRNRKTLFTFTQIFSLCLSLTLICSCSNFINEKLGLTKPSEMKIIKVFANNETDEKYIYDLGYSFEWNETKTSLSKLKDESSEFSDWFNSIKYSLWKKCGVYDRHSEGQPLTGEFTLSKNSELFAIWDKPKEYVSIYVNHPDDKYGNSEEPFNFGLEEPINFDGNTELTLEDLLADTNFSDWYSSNMSYHLSNQNKNFIRKGLHYLWDSKDISETFTIYGGTNLYIIWEEGSYTPPDNGNEDEDSYEITITVHANNGSNDTFDLTLPCYPGELYSLGCTYLWDNSEFIEWFYSLSNGDKINNGIATDDRNLPDLADVFIPIIAHNNFQYVNKIQKDFYVVWLNQITPMSYNYFTTKKDQPIAYAQGETDQLYPMTTDIEDYYLTAGKIRWESSDENVVTISSTGILRASGPGTATITYYPQYRNNEDLYRYTVYVDSGIIRVNKLFQEGVMSNWMAMSRDGSLVLAKTTDGIIHRCVNGKDWTEIQANTGLIPWLPTAAINKDGSVVAGITNGKFYKSTDKGLTWKEYSVINENNYSYNELVISADGKNLAASFYIYDSPASGVSYSFDGGKTWSTEILESNYDPPMILEIDISDTGETIVAATSYGTWIYTKATGKFTPVHDTSEYPYMRTAKVNEDGSIIILNDKISRDSGKTWSDFYWQPIIATKNLKTIYSYSSLSEDYGETWNNLGQDFNFYYRQTAISDDGKISYALGGSRIYKIITDFNMGSSSVYLPSDLEDQINKNFEDFFYLEIMGDEKHNFDDKSDAYWELYILSKNPDKYSYYGNYYVLWYWDDEEPVRLLSGERFFHSFPDKNVHSLTAVVELKNGDFAGEFYSINKQVQAYVEEEF